jgi:hypothetical protein
MLPKRKDDSAQSKCRAERGDERFGGDFARAIQTDRQSGAEIFVRDSGADVAIDRAGTGGQDSRDGIPPHGFEDVVGDDGFLFQIETRVCKSPARVRIGGEVKNLFDAGEMRKRLFQIEQVELDNFQARIVLVLFQMFAAAGGKIVKHTDFFGRGISEQQINQMRADEAGAAGDEIDDFLRHELPPVFARCGGRQ